MVATVAQPNKFGFILDRAKKRTPQQTRQALIRIGVLSEDGKLTAHYQPLAKAKRKAAPAKPKPAGAKIAYGSVKTTAVKKKKPGGKKVVTA